MMQLNLVWIYLIKTTMKFNSARNQLLPDLSPHYCSSCCFTARVHIIDMCFLDYHFYTFIVVTCSNIRQIDTYIYGRQLRYGDMV